MRVFNMEESIAEPTLETDMGLLTGKILFLVLTKMKR